jgi:hypothetical protein
MSKNWVYVYRNYFWKLSSAFEKADKCANPYGTMKFPALEIRFRIANSHTRWRCDFKELSQVGGWADFSKNLRASLFNKGLSNEPNFGRNHPAGQYP